MSNIDITVNPGETKTLTFNTKDKYNTENIVFNVASTCRDFVNASSTSLSSGTLTVTTSGASKRTYHVYSASAAITSIIFVIPDADADIEHYVFLINGTSSTITLTSVTVSGMSNSYYPDDISEFEIPANKGLEISVIKRGTYAIASVGGFYKK